jgi:DNA-binding helix-hairpin-helix protein with protein kinase domain
MSSPDVFDAQNRKVHLGSLVGKGAEGAVYELRDNPSLAAKIYFGPLSKDRSEKIRLMIPLRNARIEKLAAWPQTLLFQKSAKPIGFVMPKFSGHKDIHHLYSPKSRRNTFLRADWRFLIHTATNVARTLPIIHGVGCIIGDINHGSILVAQDATTKIVDCDSFQLTTNGRRFLCELGVETFTPPELQNGSLGVIRTSNHDNFALAVMVFLLLFMGRHPFAGRYLGKGEMQIPQAIRECRFPYGARRAAAQMEPPPGTPPLQIVGDDVALLFERAFAREMISGGRPNALEWIPALEKLENQTKQCASNASHWHLSSLRSCPWCQIEGQTGVALFPFIVQDQWGTGFDLDAIWRGLASIAHPGPVPPLPSPSVKLSAAANSLRGWERQRKILAVGAACIPLVALLAGAKIPFFWLLVAGIAAFFVVNKLGDRGGEVEEFRKKRDAATADWNQIQADWNTRAGPASFEAKRAELESLKVEWTQLPNLRFRKLNELQANRKQHQLNEFLEKQELDRATISGIGPGRKQTLSSYGVETAADITEDELSKVPGFGPALTAKLIAWRESIVARFRFNPRRGVDPRETDKVEQDILMERKRIENKVLAGVSELRTTLAQTMAARQHMRSQVEAAYLLCLQATADYNAVKS